MHKFGNWLESAEDPSNYFLTHIQLHGLWKFQLEFSGGSFMALAFECSHSKVTQNTQLFLPDIGLEFLGRLISIFSWFDLKCFCFSQPAHL